MRGSVIATRGRRFVLLNVSNDDAVMRSCPLSPRGGGVRRSRYKPTRRAPIGTQLKIRRLTGAIGAKVSGITLNSPLDEATFEEIHQAFLAHCMLVFREQFPYEDAF